MLSRLGFLLNRTDMVYLIIMLRSTSPMKFNIGVFRYSTHLKQKLQRGESANPTNFVSEIFSESVVVL